MDLKEIISKQVSFQSNAWSTIEKEISISEAINDIKNGKYSSEIHQLRSYLKNDEKERYDAHKKRLPGVTFCANFRSNRKKELIKEYHNLIVLDIDKLNVEELERTKIILENDHYVFTFWNSPSGRGIKGLIYFEFSFEIEISGIDISHKWAFKQVTDYFRSNYSIELDISGSDTTRLCFLSYDPELIFKNDFIPFRVNEYNETSLFEEYKNERPKEKVLKTRYISSKDHLKNPKGKNNQRDKSTIVKIIKFLTKEKESVTSTYDDWYRVALAIANSFTHDIGEKYFLRLCELDGLKHDEIQSKNMLLYCYHRSKGKIKFSTITYMAIKKGFKIQKGNST